MTTLHIEVSDELGALLQREASQRQTSCESIAQNFLRLKTEEVEKQRDIFQTELDAAWEAFNEAKSRGESKEKVATLDEAIDEVLDKIDVFEMKLRGPNSQEIVSWDDVKKELRARHSRENTASAL